MDTIAFLRAADPMRIVASIMQTAVIGQILSRHQTRVPVTPPAGERSPPAAMAASTAP